MSQSVTKLNLTTAETIVALGSSNLFKRLRHHRWLIPLQPSRPGRPSLYPLSRVLAAQARMESGDFPPALPCELRATRGVSHPDTIGG